MKVHSYLYESARGPFLEASRLGKSFFKLSNWSLVIRRVIESLEELLYIYYDKYLNNKTNTLLNKINYYKSMIENHPKYNEEIKETIEIKLEKL